MNRDAFYRLRGRELEGDRPRPGAGRDRAGVCADGGVHVAGRRRREAPEQLLPVRVRADRPARPHRAVDRVVRGEEDRREGVPGLIRSTLRIARCWLGLPSPCAASARLRVAEERRSSIDRRGEDYFAGDYAAAAAEAHAAGGEDRRGLRPQQRAPRLGAAARVRPGRGRGRVPPRVGSDQQRRRERRRADARGGPRRREDQDLEGRAVRARDGVNFYLGLIYYMRQDYGNARGAFENALFKLRDIDPEKNKQTRRGSREQLRARVADARPRCCQRLGRDDLAQANFDYVDEEPPAPRAAGGLRVERAVEPAARRRFRLRPAEGDGFRRRDRRLRPDAVGGRPDPAAGRARSTAGRSTSATSRVRRSTCWRWRRTAGGRASTRSARSKRRSARADHRRRGRPAWTRRYNRYGDRQRDDLIVAGALIGAGLLLKATSQADMRQWEMLPRTTFVLPLEGRAGHARRDGRVPSDDGGGGGVARRPGGTSPSPRRARRPTTSACSAGTPAPSTGRRRRLQHQTGEIAAKSVAQQKEAPGGCPGLSSVK